MKKICYITTVPGTLEAFVLKTAMFLHENTDWDISFISTGDQTFAEKLPKYIHYHQVPMKRGISLKGVGAMLQMVKIFRKEKFDLIQYSTPNASLYAAIAGKIAGIPVRLYCQWGIAYVGFHGIKRSIFKFIEKTVCALSTWVEPDSKSNLRFAHAEGLYPKGKGSVVGNGSACGIDFKKFDISKRDQYRGAIRERYHLSPESMVFGFVGRITRDKGVNELLTAFRSISEMNSGAYLLMVGPDENDGTIHQDLMDWASDSKKVVFVGVTNVVEQYLAAMDVYILPSYREGFGMGVIEAEAMGVPVIVTDIPGPIDAMKKDQTGLVVEKKNANMLMKAMTTMLEAREKLDLYGACGHRYVVENFEQGQLFAHILADRKKLLGE